MNVVFNCSTGGPLYHWADPDVEKGIGGSEECVILLARALAAMGHSVQVYNNCGDKAGEYNGVTYIPNTEEIPTGEVYIAWRNWHLCVGRYEKFRWVWCHDIPQGVHCPTRQEVADGALNWIDKFVVLNNYHQGIYVDAGIPIDYTFVAPIGVATELYDIEVERDPVRVLYFSHPGRGLDRLREIWPQVHSAVPEASLASFWWEPEHLRSYNSGLNILPMSSLGYREVAAECLKAGIFGYPCVFAPEISPATTIKAQMGGAVPVVVMQGGMVDTVKFGVKCSQGMFAQELISALRMSIAGDLEAERAEMMSWAKETYSWKSVARLWSSVW
jgi:hypothetical protein